MLAAIDAGKRPLSVEPLERLGESEGFATALLQLLERNGWFVHKPPPFAGDGVALIATCGSREAHGSGETLGKATAALLSDVATYYGVKQLEHA